VPVRRLRIICRVAVVCVIGLAWIGLVRVRPLLTILIGREVAAAEEPPVKKSGKATADGKEESWQVVYIGGTRVGYSRTVSGPASETDRNTLRTENETVMAISRFGQSVKIRTLMSSVETKAGNLREFSLEIQNPPAATQRTKGRVEGDKLLLEMDTAGKMQMAEKAWDTTVKAPGFQDRLLRENPLKPGETRAFKIYEPQTAKISTVTLKAGDFEDVELLGKEKKKLLKVNVTQTAIPGIVSAVYLDESGEAMKTTIPLLTMAMYTVPKEEALKKLTGGELDLGVSTLVKVPAIDNPHRAKKIVYRVRIEGDDPTQVLLSGDTQQVKKVEKDTADVTVTSALPPKNAPLPTANAVPAEFLGANRFLQIDDDLVKDHAAKAIGDETDPWQQCLKMEKWVSENLKKKDFSTLLASAAEVAKDLSGDCTEHATLLAAMVRTRKIPSRVAVGLVYVPTKNGEGAFGGHMWTEVFLDGRWIPLDATLGRGGIGGGHIKFSHSSYADDSPAPVGEFLPLVTALGKLSIEVREVEH